jgi:hypothetical protein
VKTLPALWQNVTLLMPGNRGESSDGKVNSTENSEEPALNHWPFVNQWVATAKKPFILRPAIKTGVSAIQSEKF